MEKIFVQIASYRDPECQWTVKDLFLKAAYPDRIHVGICWQFDENEDMHCFGEPYPRPGQVRVLNFNPRDSQGAGWAHVQAQSLWNGEDYVLQIHSHMRFEPDWDETLIAMLKRCPSEKPALATCLAGYVPPDGSPFRDSTRASCVFVHEVKPEAPILITLRGALVDKNEAMDGPSHTPFWVGPFLFARAEMFRQVPFDPYILYYGEPLAYSGRLYTHGWDLFEPDRHVLYHYWGRELPFLLPYRDIGPEKQKFTHMRICHMLRIKASPLSAALTDLEHYGLGNERSIDDFWRFAGIDMRTGEVTDLAHRARWNDSFTALQQYKQQHPPETNPPRIFVQIASYRDAECQWTVKDLFEKAKHPDRVFVGICWQFDKDEDKDCFEVETRPGQVRVAAFDCRESRGVCWARRQTQLLWNGEEYTLMIDSHMRFEFDWDERLIEDLALCGSPKAVLSNYPAGYTPPHELEVGAKPTVQRAHPYEGGDIRFRGDNLDRNPEKPLRGAFIAAGLMFARSEIIREIPYDPYLYFNQEELSLAARLFTHGWDVHSMRQVLVYHLYLVDPAKKKRRLHWEDNTDWGQMQENARKRMDHLMGHILSDDPLITRDLMLYGLGDARTLDEFSAFCGVDFKRKIISEKALRCGFIPDLLVYKNEPIYIPELDGARTPKPTPSLMRPPVLSFPNPEQSARQPYGVILLADNTQRALHVDTAAPQGMLVISDYLEKPLADALMRHAASHDTIDDIAGSMLSLFNDIFCHRLAPFYGVDFEWYERPLIERHAAGQGYSLRHGAEQWHEEEKAWNRADRDYSVLLCLNDSFEGGELHFTTKNYTLRPAPGMLVAFPSSHGFQHEAKPTASGTRYAVASWGAAWGTERTGKPMPQGAVYVGQRRQT